MQTPKVLGRSITFICNHEACSKLNQLGGKKYNVGDEVPGVLVRAGENNIGNLLLFADADEVCRIQNVNYSINGTPGTWKFTEGATGTQEAAA